MTTPAADRRLLVAAALLLAQAGVASAQPESTKRQALEVFQTGKAHYAQGEWQPAIDRFWKSYAIYPVPEILYSLGQTYRRAGDCGRAAELFRRYLADRPQAANREEVERALVQLDGECREPAPPSAGPPPPAIVARSAARRQDLTAPLLTIDAEAGIAFFALGAEIAVPAQPTVGLVVTHPLIASPVAVGVGARAAYTPVPWRDNERAGERGDAAFTCLTATVTGRIAVTRRLAVGADLGAGVLILSGIETASNAFVDDGIEADGAISLVHVRAGIGAQFAITDRVVVGLSPVVSYSPTIDGMRDSVPGLRRLELLSSIGYRL